MEKLEEKWEWQKGGGKGRRRFERKEGEWKVNGIEEKVLKKDRETRRDVCAPMCDQFKCYV